MIIDAKLKWKFCLNKLHVGVINGFNCSSIANDKVFGNSESTSRSFSFFTKIVSNEEIFISDSVSIKINYDIFNMPLSQRNSDSAEAGKWRIN